MGEHLLSTLTLGPRQVFLIHYDIDPHEYP